MVYNSFKCLFLTCSIFLKESPQTQTLLLYPVPFLCFQCSDGVYCYNAAKSIFLILYSTEASSVVTVSFTLGTLKDLGSGMKCSYIQIVSAPKETVKSIFIHLTKMAPLALCSYSLEMNFACPFSPLQEREFRLSQNRGSKLCSSAAVRSEPIMPASEQQHSRLYSTCLCAKSELIVLRYAQKNRGCPSAVLFLFFNV